MNLADRIQDLRKRRGLSQEELADKLGVSRQAVSKWESGQSTPDIERIILMSEFFDVTTDYLLKGTEPVEEEKKEIGKSLYVGFAVLFGALSGIWAYTANRFRYEEIFFIALLGAVIGYAIALILQTMRGEEPLQILKRKRKK